MKTLDEYVWVFIGCGGTFYTTSPYLAVLHRRYKPKTTILIDPDVVEEGNYDRQWPGFRPGISKVAVADELVHSPDLPMSVCIVDEFNPSDRLLDAHTKGKPVLAIVNVDNDIARLQVADWLENRISPGIMVVSGCERTFGQCYPGIWMDGEPIFDWRDCHKDVGVGPSSPDRCNAQDVRANAMTGVLVGMCIEDIAHRLEHDSLQSVTEFYWLAAVGQSPRMWASIAMCRLPQTDIFLSEVVKEEGQ